MSLLLVYRRRVGQDLADAFAYYNEQAEGLCERFLRVVDSLTVQDPDSVGEPRFITVGLGSAGELLVVVYTERNDEYRIISARRPTRKERKFYED